MRTKICWPIVPPPKVRMPSLWKRPSWYAMVGLAAAAGYEHGWWASAVVYGLLISVIALCIRKLGTSESTTGSRMIRWIWIVACMLILMVWDGQLPLGDLAKGLWVLVVSIAALVGVTTGIELNDKYPSLGYGVLVLMVSIIGWMLALMALGETASPRDWDDDIERCEPMINPC